MGEMRNYFGRRKFINMGAARGGRPKLGTCPLYPRGIFGRETATLRK
jgi:hypothetical protein